MASAKEMMEAAGAKIAAQKDTLKSIDAVFKFDLEGEGGGTYLVNLKDDVGVKEGDGPADCTIRMSASDYVDMLSGSANPQMLFFQGRLKIEGDIGLAMKLQNLTDVLR